MNETLEVGGLTFEVRRSVRRTTLGLTVDRGGELLVHAPESAATGELARWARSRLLWVHRKLAVKQALSPQVRQPEFVTGETFRYLGRSRRLVIVAQQDEPLRSDGLRFLLRRDARESAANHFRNWYIAVGGPWILKRVGLFASRAGASPKKIALRDLGFRWGSCGRSGVVYFNWKLLQLPVRVVDYVIAHELAHLREPHHRPEFWRILDATLPDWRDRREELETRARDIYWCHERMAR